MAYNELINIINAQAKDGDQLWSFKGIKGHRKKIKKWEVLVDWDHTNESWEPLNEMRLADSITLAEYAIKNKLFYQPGWKWAKKKRIKVPRNMLVWQRSLNPKLRIRRLGSNSE